MPCIVNEGKDGVLFSPGDAKDLYRSVQHLWEDQRKLAVMAENARIEFNTKYTAEANYQALMEIYNSAMNIRSAKFKKLTVA